MSTNKNNVNAIIGAIVREDIPDTPRKTSASAIMGAAEAGYAYDVSNVSAEYAEHICRNTRLAFVSYGVYGVTAALRMDNDGNAYVCSRTSALFNFL